MWHTYLYLLHGDIFVVAYSFASMTCFLYILILVAQSYASSAYMVAVNGDVRMLGGESICVMSAYGDQSHCNNTVAVGQFQRNSSERKDSVSSCLFRAQLPHQQ